MMAGLDDIIAIGEEFFKHWYSCSSASTMDDAICKLVSSHAKTPKLKSLPSTDEALEEHVKFADNQAMLWKTADIYINCLI